jgi:FKBP-type peptidyl-prolyl cis-trans isomerase
MKKTTLLLGAFALLLLASACKNSGFKKTKSGLMYKIIPNGNGPMVKRGDVIKLSYIYTVHDSTLGSSAEGVPFFAKVDSMGPTYDPGEIFMMLHKGDSAVIIQSADTIAKKQGMLPEFIKPKDKLILKLKVVEVFTVDSIAQQDKMAEMQKAQAKQREKFESMKASKAKELEDYLAKNNIKTQKAPAGTFVEVKEPGNGPKVDSGKACKIRYTGKTFPALTTFETNMDGSRPPFDVNVGARMVIQGWDEGLRFFKQGGKGTLYIPFYLGYGPQGRPEGGKPYETLVFDVVVDSVKDAPPPAPQPQQPMMPMPPPGAQGQQGHNHR